MNKVWITAIGSVFIVAVFIYILRLPSLNIENISVTSGGVTDEAEILSLIEEEIAGKYLWLIPESSVFFYPKSRIENRIIRQFARIYNLDLSIMQNRSLAVSFSEREEKYIWCRETPDLTDAPATAEPCYFLDGVGYIFAEAPYFSGDVYFKFYGGLGEGQTPVGSVLMEERFVEYTALIDTLKGMGIEPIGLHIRQSGDARVLLDRAANGNQPEIILKTDSDFTKLAENLQSALAAEPLMSSFKNKYSSLLYIDLRFGNKVYYKFSQ